MKLEPLPGGGFEVDAADLGPELGVAPADVPALMRQGRIISLFESGEGDDAGRFRVTFRYGATRLRLTVDASGNVLSRSKVNTPPPPAGLDRR